MLSFIIVGFIAGSAMAQTPEMQPKKEKQEMTQQTSKTKITLDQVPVEVQESFMDNDYQLASVENIFEVAKKDETIYEFIIKSDTQKWAVHFDEEGKLIKENKVDAGK